MPDDPEGELPASPTERPEPAAVEEPALPPGPIQPQERMELIDVLRGLALFGIIAANMRGFAGPLATYFQPGLLWKTRADYWVQAFLDAFIQGKFITIFAFLFGVGFAVQLGRLEQRSAHPVRVYCRRLAALLVIGAIHQLAFWWGDILVSYALGGFCLLFFRKRKNKTILVWTLCLMLAPIAGGFGYLGYRRLRPQPPEKIAQERKEAIENRAKQEAAMWQTIRVYQSGSYPAIFRERLGELLRQNRAQPFVVLFTLPIFLLGLWVWRQGILQDPEAQRLRLRQALIAGALIGIPANVVVTWGTYEVQRHVQVGPPTPFMLTGFLIAIFGRPALSMSYASALGLLWMSPAWRPRLRPFAAIGRTALSNYLLQTIACTTIFYGYGGGLFAKVSLGWLLVLSVVIYALEIPLSRWWLSRCRFGPAEWIWRSMTYGERPAMRAETVA